MSDETRKRKRVLILGAGFGGLYTALYLEKALGKNAHADITLVDKNTYHLFTPMLHEAATGVIHPGLIMAPIRRILRGHKTEFLRARVDNINLQAQEVEFCCMRMPYDILVIGLGSTTDFYGLESVKARALELKTVRDAERLRCHVIDRFEAATREGDPKRRQVLLTFAVVGGGCTGVEVVTELHEFLLHLREEQYEAIDPSEMHTLLVEAQDRVLPQMDRTLSRSAVRRMLRMGIEVKLNTKVVEYTEEGLLCAGECDPLPVETLVWAAGVRANPVLDALSLQKDRMRRVVVGSDLSVPDCPNVYVLGDAARALHPETSEVYPPTAQVAYRQARVVAANIAADIARDDGDAKGGAHQRFDFTYIGDLVSLGRLTGVADPTGIKLKGFSAWLMWKFYYLLTLVGWQNRLRVALNWVLALLFPANSSLPTQCPPDCDAEMCL